MDDENTENKSVSEISSDDSISDVEPRILPKRYKLALSSTYAPSDVSRQTRQKWERLSLRLRTTDNSSANLLESTSSGVETNNEAAVENLENVHFSSRLSDDNDFNRIPMEEDKCDIQLDDVSDPEYESERENANIIDEYSDIENDSQTATGTDSDGTEDYSAKNEEFFNKIMFTDSNLQVRDVIILINAVSLKLRLHDEGKLVLGELVKILAGDRFQNFNLSKYMMNKCFSSEDQSVNYHYYCSKCSASELYSVNANSKSKYKQGLICVKCKNVENITKASANYFLSLDVKKQMQTLLSNPVIIDDVLKNVESRLIEPGIIQDVNGGSIHQEILENTSDMDPECIILTVNFSTDGAPLTKSGKRGFWPIQIFINDLSPKLRFHNALLCGLLMTDKEPESILMNLYISKTYVNQMKYLFTEGIQLEHRDKVIRFKFSTHSCIVDAIARRIVQNRVQFNGYYGCSWCYQLGEYMPNAHGIRYLVTQDGENRSNSSQKEDVELVQSGQRVRRGVKGPCALMELDHFDMVWSFAYEYLHGLLLGVTLTLWNEWKGGDSDFRISKTEIDFIEKRFLTITPNHDIHRMPRSGIIKGTAKPKGSECKSWLLYYSLPCLYGVLNTEALNHYKLLVKSAYTVLQPGISHNELNECERDFLRFVVDYEKYYGPEKMTFNVHSLLHIVESIRKSGPLCYNSAFPTEGNIYTLKQYVTGPTGMDRQIARKHLQSLIFKSDNLQNMSHSYRTTEFCSNLFNPIRFSKSFRRGLDITYCEKR